MNNQKIYICPECFKEYNHICILISHAKKRDHNLNKKLDVNKLFSLVGFTKQFKETPSASKIMGSSDN